MEETRGFVRMDVSDPTSPVNARVLFDHGFNRRIRERAEHLNRETMGGLVVLDGPPRQKVKISSSDQ